MAIKLMKHSNSYATLEYEFMGKPIMVDGSYVINGSTVIFELDSIANGETHSVILDPEHILRITTDVEDYMEFNYTLNGGRLVNHV